MPSALLIVGGLAALIVGAELLVRGGTGLATRFGIRPMVIGLTVVSLGTSVPELAIGIDAAVTGSPGLAVGNIVGANLVNVLLILGLSALLVPVVFQRRTLRFELPAMIAAALALYLLSLDGTLVRVEGLLLLVGGAAYTGALLRINRRDSPDMASDTPVDAAGGEVAVLARGGHRPLRDTAALLAGMLLIVLGAELLVEGAVSGAESLGVSEAVIGLTVVAVGTTAPELVTTLVSLCEEIGTSRSATSSVRASTTSPSYSDSSSWSRREAYRSPTRCSQQTSYCSRSSRSRRRPSSCPAPASPG
jgi:cation:H+ antiporter